MNAITYANLNVKMLLYWIKERHSIYLKRQAGKAKPWTKDPILQTYRFCNVYRELDVVTKWINEVWRTPNDKDPNLWFAMVVARLINWPPTMAILGYPLRNDTKKGPWIPDHFVGTIRHMQNLGAKAYGGAYIVSTNGHAMEKAEYLADRVLGPLWAARRGAPVTATTLLDMHQWLSQFDGLGSFMAGQVVADIKYSTQYSPVICTDWWSFAASGPGSRRGLNRILGYGVDNPWKERQWHTALLLLGAIVEAKLPNIPRIHMQDLQNCLCEYDKYMRVKLGEGRPRSLYPGLR